MIEIASIGLGFSLTEAFIFSLGVLYLIDFKTRTFNIQTRIFYILMGVVSLMVFLLGLIYTGKFIVYNSFLFEHKDLAVKFLTVGIIFGSITFPFMLRLSTKILLKH
ncbi:hypothetical protein SAMN06265182_1534 [Persephonella hydrogeniphila]|uniref:Uncharacterized protein n=1 Tax=Persephonella hydrogeniphila TaxID=198703 RepID=A0A285NKK8_9AQUI|nr:hypothetical protein [Persephonella hydrogeniphila]SNZ09463.1 hypothetical protein SAMN06265182_1534 [Persephonella hydrogeniphila]